jgi:hypothetical protein
MRPRTGAAVACAVVIAAIVSLLVSADGPATQRGSAARQSPSAPTPSHETSRPDRFGGAREDCSTRSEARFPGGFTSRRNLVVGPFALQGGTFTDARTVWQYGGNKLPVLVKAGHTVTVRIARRGRASAGLAFGPLPQGENTLRDTYDTVSFVACRPGRPPARYSADGPSSSDADGIAVTFWSGFVLTRAPACVPLLVYIDGASRPRRVGVGLGRRCA